MTTKNNIVFSTTESYF